MRTFGRGMLYSIIAVAVLLVISFVIGETIYLPWYIFIPLLILIWGLAFYQSSRERAREGNQ